MQTLLPYRSFESSAKVLDHESLRRQRVEALQIMEAVVTGKTFRKHPVTRMWRGYAFALLSYQRAICDEWVGRGYSDSCLARTEELFMQLGDEARLPRVPPWLGKKAFHSSHRANLLRISPTHYNQYHWPETASSVYWYPGVTK